MNIDWVREYCMALPHTTENLQWGDDLLFKIGGKMFAVLVLKPAPVWLSFKCTEEEFAELIERSEIIPAPYMARHHWVSLQTPDALRQNELERLLHRSYELVLEKLPCRTRESLARSAPSRTKIKSTNKPRPRRRAR